MNEGFPAGEPFEDLQSAVKLTPSPLSYHALHVRHVEIERLCERERETLRERP